MELKNLHLEISTYCNAKCPMCPHDNSGFTHPLIHLSLENLQNILENPVTAEVEFIQLCGTHGDPIMHKDILQLIKLIKNKKPIAKIEISTNGSMRKQDFWNDLAGVLGPSNHVIFGIDGLSDTHHLYRINTDFYTIIENAKSFINANGNAWWQFIPFEHNQHQIIDALQMSQKLKFQKFFIKYERACYNNKLKAPTLPQSQFKELISSRPHHDLGSSFKQSKQFSKNCIHLNQKSIYIKADGTATPCCFMSGFPNSSIHYKKVDQQEIDKNIDKLMKSWQKFATAFFECKRNCYSTL